MDPTTPYCVLNRRVACLLHCIIVLILLVPWPYLISLIHVTFMTYVDMWVRKSWLERELESDVRTLLPCEKLPGCFLGTMT